MVRDRPLERGQLALDRIEVEAALAFVGAHQHVNESRVVTYLGGDILLLSNHGDLNAGRGSNTSVISRDPGAIAKCVAAVYAEVKGSGT